MLDFPNSSGFCLFCYKTIAVSKVTVENSENIGKFVKIISRLHKSQETNRLCTNFDTDNLLQCCKKCRGIIEDICEVYHHLKIFELTLDCKLDNLVEEINYANKVPTRWMHVNKVLEEAFQKDIFKKEDCQRKIRKFRQTINVTIHQRKLQSQPRILLRRTEYFVQPKVSSSSLVSNKSPNSQDTKTIDRIYGRTRDWYKNCVCPKCGKKLHSFKRFKEHFELHKDQSEWKYKCSYCLKKFVQQTNLNAHLRKHTGERPYKCGFCAVGFRFRSNFTRHLKSAHGNEKELDKELKRKWINQSVKGRGINSENVNSTGNSSNNLDTNIKNKCNSNTTTNSFTSKKNACPKCGKVLKSSDGLKIHLEHHKDRSEWKWPCHICAKRFTGRQNLNVHVRTHTGEKPYKCRFCERKFGYRVALTSHLKTKHNNEKGVEKELKRKWVIKTADVEHKSTKLLNTEQINEPPMITSHDDEIEYDDDMPELDDYSEDIMNDVEVDPEENYLPETEGIAKELDNNDIDENMEIMEGTANFQDPLIQIKVEHQVLVEEKPRNLKTESTKIPKRKQIKKKSTRSEVFECTKCKKILNSSFCLQIHMKGHRESKSCRCKTCGKHFKTKFGLQTHMRAHLNKTPFKCRYCGQKYLYKLRLVNHLKDKHEDEKGVDEEIKCKWVTLLTNGAKKPLTKTSHTQVESLIKDRKFSICGNCREPFSTLQLLKAHMNGRLCTKMTSNANEIIKCETCKKVFHLDKDLWLHQRNFHEEKVCLDCGKQFRKTFNFKIHLEYHKDPKEWKFTCEICGKKCVSSCKLKEHMANHSRKNYKRKHRVIEKNETDLKSDYVAIKRKPYHFIKPQENRHGQKIKCGDCMEIITIGKDLWLHQRDVHEKKICLECGKQFDRMAALREHLEYHKDPMEWKFECEVCGKKCVTIFKLREHMARHLKNKNGKVSVINEEVIKNIKGQAGINPDNEDPSKMKVVAPTQTRYGLRKNRARNFVSVEEVDSDDNETIDMNKKSVDWKVQMKKPSTSMAIKNISGKIGICIEEGDLNKEINESEIKVTCANDLNVLDENNLLTEKGDCFGDGNLVEFEDLD